MTTKRLLRLTAIVTSTLTLIAALPKELGPVAALVPADWKPFIVKAAIIATILLQIIHEFTGPDGGTVQSGNVAAGDIVGGNKTQSK